MRRKPAPSLVDPLSTLETELADLNVLAELLRRHDPFADPGLVAYLSERVGEHVERARAAVPGIFKLLPRPEPDPAPPAIDPVEAARLRAGIEALFAKPKKDDGHD
jgi:uncharacterized protein (DUF885 family)